MFDDLLPYYNNELRFIREFAAEFSSAHPQIAGRLRLSHDAVEDPHVSRLIEAFAFLNARIRMKLDDEFPELTESVLGLLQPHFLAPIPSMAVVELTPQSSLRGSRLVAKGAAVTTEAVDGEVAQYRTGYDVEVWPIQLTQASLTGLPLVAPPNRDASRAVAVLRLSLTCQAGVTFAQLSPDRLRVHIASEPRVAQILYELVTSATLSVALADSAADVEPVILGPGAIRAVGLSSEEVILPQAPGAEPGYALLTEYFAFPQKFQFFDICGLSAKTLLAAGSTLEIFLYLDRTDPSIEGMISKSDLRLYCTPIINLFQTQADPIRLDPGKFEHRIVPDARRETSMEVYSVDKVVVSDRSGNELAYRPFFSLGRRQAGRDQSLRYWHARRRTSPYPGGGDDVYLSVLDEAGAGGGDREHVAAIDITATNRNLPDRLPFGAGRPVLSLADDTAVASTLCLGAPTRALRPRRGQGALWRLVSLMSLNHLSVADEALALDIVKEMLALFDHSDGRAGLPLIERLKGVRTAPAMARAPGGGRIAFTSGVDLTLEFDDRRLSGSGAFMLGAVLEAAFASLSAINAFTRTRLKIKGEQGLWHAWTARTGTRRLI